MDAAIVAATKPNVRRMWTMMKVPTTTTPAPRPCKGSQAWLVTAARKSAPRSTLIQRIAIFERLICDG